MFNNNSRSSAGPGATKTRRAPAFDDLRATLGALTDRGDSGTAGPIEH
jgi:hypothetical protein